MFSTITRTFLAVFAVTAFTATTSVLAGPLHHHHSTHRADSQPASAENNSKWLTVLAEMTQSNPCGSAENFTTCSRCGALTGDDTAFYRCCLNTEDIRPWCIQFLNHKIE